MDSSLGWAFLLNTRTIIPLSGAFSQHMCGDLQMFQITYAWYAADRTWRRHEAVGRGGEDLL